MRITVISTLALGLILSTTSLHAQSDSGPMAIELTLGSAGLEDWTYIQFVDTADFAFDAADARKLPNLIFNLSTFSSDGEDLAINVISGNDCSFSIPVHLSNLNSGEFSLSWDIMNSRLIDRYEISMLDADEGDLFALADIDQLNFTIDEGIESTQRFSLLFETREFIDQPVMQVNQSCQELETGTVTIGSSVVGAEYILYDNGEVIATLDGTDEPLVYNFDRSSVGSGNNEFVLMSHWKGCDASFQQSEVSADILEMPVLSFDPDTKVLRNTTGRAGDWYRDGIMITSESLAEIVPTEDGNHTIEVRNESCNVKSIPFVIADIKVLAPELEVSLAPNPAINFVKVLNLKPELPPAKVRVFDFSGKIFFDGEVSASANDIDVSSFPKGLYILQTEKDGKAVTRKFMKD